MEEKEQQLARSKSPRRPYSLALQFGRLNSHSNAMETNSQLAKGGKLAKLGPQFGHSFLSARHFCLNLKTWLECCHFGMLAVSQMSLAPIG